MATMDSNDAFERIVRAFARDGDVTRGGKGFGATGLKVDGKLFAFVSSKGQFVAKLPRERVDALVRAGAGEYFDPGHGRRMKDWLALAGSESEWLGLAKEAKQFVRGGASRRPLRRA